MEPADFVFFGPVYIALATVYYKQGKLEQQIKDIEKLIVVHGHFKRK